jgi:hypothetical protein
MARIRTLKPEFHSHEDLSCLPPETHLLAAALVNYADDEGYFNAHPVLVKAGTNPLRNDPTPLDEQLHQLCKIGYIILAQRGDKCFGRIVTFSTHQRVSNPTPSKLRAKFEELPKLSRENLELFVPEGKGREQGREQGGECAPPPPERSDSQPIPINSEALTLVDRIIVTHPRSAARHLSFAEVTPKQRLAVLGAANEEMARAGVSKMAALEMILERVESHARDVPLDQHHFFKEIEGYFKNYDYRIPAENFMGKEKRNGAKSKGDSALAVFAESVEEERNRSCFGNDGYTPTGGNRGSGTKGLLIRS